MRIDDADQVVAPPPPVLCARLVREDRQAAVDLHGVGHDDVGVEALGEGQCDLRLAERRGPEERDDRSRPRPATPSPSAYRSTVKRSATIGFVRRDARLLQSDRHLLLDRVDAGQVGQQHTAPHPGRDDHPVAPWIELVECRGLARAEHVDRTAQGVDLVHGHRGEAGVTEGRGRRVADDLAAEVGLGRGQRADAPPQLALPFERDEASGATCVERTPGGLRWPLPPHRRLEAGAGEVGGPQSATRRSVLGVGLGHAQPGPPACAPNRATRYPTPKGPS